jgi:hypothetical protein
MYKVHSAVVPRCYILDLKLNTPEQVSVLEKVEAQSPVHSSF